MNRRGLLAWASTLPFVGALVRREPDAQPPLGEPDPAILVRLQAWRDSWPRCRTCGAEQGMAQCFDHVYHGDPLPRPPVLHMTAAEAEEYECMGVDMIHEDGEYKLGVGFKDGGWTYCGTPIVVADRSDME